MMETEIANSPPMMETEITNSPQGRRGNPGWWQPGVSGNPAGRPPGARHKATMAAEALLDGEAEAIAGKLVELAKSGEMAAIRLAMDRICPPRKDRPVNFALPRLEQASDAAAAAAAISDAVATGDLTPSEATELSRFLSAYVATLEAADFDARLRKLEAPRHGSRA
jgi:Family of unknown function (DUF5681)